MPLSADRCQVTWGPNPLKRVKAGRGRELHVYVYVCRCICDERAQSMCTTRRYTEVHLG